MLKIFHLVILKFKACHLNIRKSKEEQVPGEVQLGISQERRWHVGCPCGKRCPEARPGGWQGIVSGRSSRKKCRPGPFYVGASLEDLKHTEKAVLMTFCSFPSRQKSVLTQHNTTSQEKSKCVHLCPTILERLLLLKKSDL